MAAGMLSLAPLARGRQRGPKPAPPLSRRPTRPSLARIVKLATDSIEIRGHKGMAQTFAINSETKYGTTEKAEKYEDFKDGEHVRINYAEVDGKQVARQIQELPAHHRGKSYGEQPLSSPEMRRGGREFGLPL